mmetsp:Transcript_52726/g.118349  ORF Transcript_52726/g.118349 Transcript_52726/m.118349 type:complete len:206 (+) Transcript_52726:350-967(+)
MLAAGPAEHAPLGAEQTPTSEADGSARSSQRNHLVEAGLPLLLVSISRPILPGGIVQPWVSDVAAACIWNVEYCRMPSTKSGCASVSAAKEQVGEDRRARVGRKLGDGSGHKRHQRRQPSEDAQAHASDCPKAAPRDLLEKVDAALIWGLGPRDEPHQLGRLEVRGAAELRLDRRAHRELRWHGSHGVGHHGHHAHWARRTRRGH